MSEESSTSPGKRMLDYLKNSVTGGRTARGRPRMSTVIGIPIGPDAYITCFYDALRRAEI